MLAFFVVSGSAVVYGKHRQIFPSVVETVVSVACLCQGHAFEVVFVSLLLSERALVLPVEEEFVRSVKVLRVGLLIFL